jgi:hypothetical protein
MWKYRAKAGPGLFPAGFLLALPLQDVKNPAWQALVG